MKKKFTPKQYSQIYAEADAIIKERNPCGIRSEADGRVSCNRTRHDPHYERNGKSELCCTNCKHLGPQGCTVESLGCKLGACCGFTLSVAQWPKDVDDQITALRLKAEGIGFVPWDSVRATKAEYFKEARRYVQE